MQEEPMNLLQHTLVYSKRSVYDACVEVIVTRRIYHGQ